MNNNTADDITKDAIFGHVMSKPENSLHLIRSILPQLDIQEIRIEPQKEINQKLIEKNTRFDIWAIDSNNVKYDIEMQTTDSPDIGRRVRYYLSKIDEETLNSGQDYRQLNPVYIIFFCTFDPGKRGRSRYEYSLTDYKDKDLVLDTSAHFIFYNSNGDNQDITPELKAFLDYMNGNVTKDNSYIQKLDQEVKEYVSSPEWRRSKMDFDMKLADARYEGIEQGKQQGLELGIKQEKQYGAVQLVNTLKELGISNDQIYAKLVAAYGKDFSGLELRKIMKKA